MKTFLKSFMLNESGVSAVKYALLLAVVGVALVSGALALFDAIDGAMSMAAGCSDPPNTAETTDC